MNIKIMVAAHKAYRMPESELYLPVLVGADVNKIETPKGYVSDNKGDNISLKNPLYCELTALYWGWKNLDCEYLGLAHYRRHFGYGKEKDVWNRVLKQGDAEKMIAGMKKNGKFVILPKKRHYIIETLYSHYEHSHHLEDLQAMAEVISRYYPAYNKAYVQVMKRRSAHMFNMCIMRKDLLDDYCTWLFDVLFRVEEILDISSYSDFDKRVFGRLSELLLDVWMTKNEIPFEELPVVHMEGENWGHKISLFLKRKFLKK